MFNALSSTSERDKRVEFLVRNRFRLFSCLVPDSGMRRRLSSYMEDEFWTEQLPVFGVAFVDRGSMLFN